MNDSAAKQKALEIYRDNQAILDFIFKCKPDWTKKAAADLCEALIAHGATIVTEKQNGELARTDRYQRLNLMFTTPELLKHPNYFFQINVSDMRLSLYRLSKNAAGQSSYPTITKQYLFDNNKAITDRQINNFEHAILANPAVISDTCQSAINALFQPDGFIARAIQKIKNV